MDLACKHTSDMSGFGDGSLNWGGYGTAAMSLTCVGGCVLESGQMRKHLVNDSAAVTWARLTAASRQPVLALLGYANVFVLNV